MRLYLLSRFDRFLPVSAEGTAQCGADAMYESKAVTILFCLPESGGSSYEWVQTIVFGGRSSLGYSMAHSVHGPGGGGNDMFSSLSIKASLLAPAQYLERSVTRLLNECSGTAKLASSL